jgi:hypothetical protein
VLWLVLWQRSTCTNYHTQDAGGALGKVVQFKEVLACKSSGGSLLLRGSARFANAVVEGVVQDTFLAPSVTHDATPVPLSKVLVTAIRVPEPAGIASVACE